MKQEQIIRGDLRVVSRGGRQPWHMWHPPKPPDHPSSHCFGCSHHWWLLQHWLSIIIGLMWIWIAGSDVFSGALPSSYPGWCCLLWTNGRFSYHKMQGATHGYGSGRINTHQNSPVHASTHPSASVLISTHWKRPVLITTPASIRDSTHHYNVACSSWWAG